MYDFSMNKKALPTNIMKVTHSTRHTQNSAILEVREKIIIQQFPDFL
jgi:hypothetical protein